MSGSDLFLGLLEFTFYYPLIMSILWVTGSIYYFFYRERRKAEKPHQPPIIVDSPPVSFVIPCHNEAENIAETVQSLLDQDYDEFEIIVIDDASTDETGELLDVMAAANPRVRVIHFETNQGKAMGLQGRRAGGTSRDSHLPGRGCAARHGMRRAGSRGISWKAHASAP